MSERKECKKYINCGFRKELAGCPLSCIHYKHKDEVRVVRCKDCKHSYMGVANIMCGRCGQNINGIRVGGSSVKEEHFCSYGERKDNERKAD